MNKDAKALIAQLELEPLPIEGGYFRRSYTSIDELGVEGGDTDDAQPQFRPLATAIYFLLTDDANCFSELHMLATDEVYHFYLGDPVELLMLTPDGETEKHVLGQDVSGGQHVQFVVPGGIWQGSRLMPGGKFALTGTTMAPGWDDRDYISGNRKALTDEFPGEAALIEALTRVEEG